MRVGVVRHFFEKDLLTNSETIAALETSVVALRDLGAVVDDVNLGEAVIHLLTGLDDTHAHQAITVR